MRFRMELLAARVSNLLWRAIYVLRIPGGDSALLLQEKHQLERLIGSNKLRQRSGDFRVLVWGSSLLSALTPSGF